MSLNFAKALNIENHERSVVFLLLAQSVFLGIFAGALDVGANALFLDAYSADKMPQAFMISGAVGIFFTTFYTFLQNKIKFQYFTIVNLLVVIILTALLRFGYELYDDPRLAFAVLVMMGPLIIISMLSFWGTAGRYFTLREGKRLFGIIDTGSVVGMILAFYAVPVLMNFNFQTYNTLLIGLVSLVVAMFLQVVVLRKHKIVQRDEKGSIISRKTNPFSIFRKRYTSLMAVFVMLSVIAAFFIHYSFMWVTEENYADIKELTSFLGAFFGTMMIFTVIIKSTLYSWLMKNYGLRVTLLISPILLLILTVVASFVGGFFGYSAEAASFTMFFLVIALSKLFNKSLKDAIESPSMKILYQSLDSSERFDVQAKIDGIVNEFTAFSAGLIMAGLLLLKSIQTIHFSYILSIILIVWVILGYLLYKSYRGTLNESLASAKSHLKNARLEKEQEKVNFHEIFMISDLLKLDPNLRYSLSHEDIVLFLQSEDSRKHHIVLRFLDNTLNYIDLKVLDRVAVKATDHEITDIINRQRDRENFKLSDAKHAFMSGEKNKILAALSQTVVFREEKNIPHIIKLLRDRDLDIRSAAIEAAGRMKAKGLGSYLVDYLDHPDLFSVAWWALVNMGAPVLENLENAFHKTGAEVKLKLRIVRAMSAIGGEKAGEYLFSKIDYHHREIREVAIQSLYNSNYVPNPIDLPKLHTAIYEATLAGAVNIATEIAVRENDPGNGLLEAVYEEKRRIDNLIFMLLGITYDKSVIEHVQESLSDSDSIDSGFALEMLNLLVDDQVFAYLEPYFDDIHTVEKIRRLQNEMPVEILSYDNLLIDIINRDTLFTGNYIRICAIDAIGSLDDIDAGKYLAAQLFHPHPAISGFASIVLGEKNPELYKNIIERLDSESVSHLEDGFIRGHITGKRLIQLVENIKMWRVFKEVDRELLLKLANHFIAPDDRSLSASNRVTFIKSNEYTDRLLFEGMVLILSDYKEFSDHITYLATKPGIDYYQMNIREFRELIFDQEKFRSIIRESFCRPETKRLLNIKV